MSELKSVPVCCNARRWCMVVHISQIQNSNKILSITHARTNKTEIKCVYVYVSSFAISVNVS